MRTWISILFMLVIALLPSATNIKAQTVVNRTSIKCMGVELDGSQTLRVIGYGKNRADAKEQAMKNAVWTVVFDGIREGVAGCNMRPLVTEANARERYEDYFNTFFADGGDYKKYVSLRDTKKGSAARAKDKVGYSYEMTIRILRPQLKARLKGDNIISNEHL